MTGIQAVVTKKKCILISCEYKTYITLK